MFSAEKLSTYIILQIPPIELKVKPFDLINCLARQGMQASYLEITLGKIRLHLECPRRYSIPTDSNWYF